MTYDDFINGLKSRGFQHIEDVCNMGGCHIDERHFILLTDGLVIYSNFWDWKDCEDMNDGLHEIWSLTNPEDAWLMPNTKVFSFEELDRIMS